MRDMTRFFQWRAETLAGVQLTRRDDLAVRWMDLPSGASDFLVEVLCGRESSGHVFASAIARCDERLAASQSGRTASSWPRDSIPNLVNTLPRWYWAVRGLMNKRAPISALVRPSRAIRAT